MAQYESMDDRTGYDEGSIIELTEDELNNLSKVHQITAYKIGGI